MEHLERSMVPVRADRRKVAWRAFVRSAALVTALLLPQGARAQVDPHDQHQHGAYADTGSMAEVERQLEMVRQATERYRDHAVAVAEGFKLFGRESPLMGEHWYHPDRVRAPLDLSRPSTLQYAHIDGKRVLIGVAYGVYRRPGDPMPEGFAGDADVWHVHDVAKIADAIAADRPFVRLLVWLGERRGRAGADGRNHLTMLHAWPWLENPDGPFAQMHRALPYLRAGLPAEYAETGDEHAAWGVSLLSPGACAAEIQRVHELARLSGDQRARLARACADAEAAVRAAAHPGVEAEPLNQAAASAWKAYLAEQDNVLTARQKERLASIVEHEHAMGGG